jgi:hypothetical protein
MAQFLMLLRDTQESSSSFTPESAQAIIEDYKSWSRKMGEAGKLVGGNKLTSEGGRIARSSANGVVVTDGPFSEAKEEIGGYWLMEADDYGEAESLIADCPHLKYGGIIELRQIDQI